jgi:hypothetical protein
MHVVAAGDVADRLAVLPPLDCLPLLMRGELRPAAKPDAARLGPLAAFRRARPDQVALELCKPA